MPDEEETPDFIQEFYARKRKVKKVIDTANVNHSSNYTDVVNQLLRNEEGEVDLELLDNEDMQQQFADMLADVYIGQIKQELNIAPKEFADSASEAVYNDRLLMIAGNTTKKHLTDRIKNHGKDYTAQLHQEYSKNHIKALNENLSPTVAEHLKKEHIEPIAAGHIKYGEADLVDHKKMRLEDAIELLDKYDNGNNVITREQVKKKHYVNEVDESA